MNPFQDPKDEVIEYPWAKHRRKHFSAGRSNLRQNTGEVAVTENAIERDYKEDAGKELLPSPWTNHLRRQGGRTFGKGSDENKITVSSSEPNPVQLMCWNHL